MTHGVGAALAEALCLIAENAISAQTPAKPAEMSRPTATRPNTKELGLNGRVGPYRVGAHLTLESGSIAVSGHYFYAKHAIDIALRGQVNGERLTLRGRDGSTFDLHLANGDRAVQRPLTFRTSTSLVGFWVAGAKQLPVRLAIDLVGGPQGASRYAAITNEAGPAFEGRAARFLEGALAGNRAETASATSFPLTVNGALRHRIGNAKELYANWERVFTPCLLAKLRLAIPHEMFVRDGQAMVADGAAWFGAKGVTTINVPRCG